ncbi:MAG: tRNA threonylcarbamoyladenosine dehydratase [Prevotella sp.]|nr:tRNA threonylcarbamoyladenosine dehydratase [Prevotella sp.]
MEDKKLARSWMLFGDDGMNRLATIKVIVFGCGGVGSWCIESLVRTGVKHITIVDMDSVAESNVNRQLMATALTVGQPKVEAMRRHLLEIAPDADITAIQKMYCEETAHEFQLDDYDFVVDAIDSVKCKMLLIRNATESKARLFSSMGAALKIDPTRIAVAEFWKVKGCKLALALRNGFKREGHFPAKKFKCVYGEERLENRACPDTEKANGSLVHITGIFGFTLAGLVLKEVFC